MAICCFTAFCYRTEGTIANTSKYFCNISRAFIMKTDDKGIIVDSVFIKPVDVKRG